MENIGQPSDSVNTSNNKMHSIKHPKYYATPALISIFVTILISLCFIFKIDIISTGRGVIIPSSEAKHLKSPVSSVISTVHFQKGKYIQEGDKLITFDMSRERGEMSIIENNIESCQKNLQMLSRITDIDYNKLLKTNFVKFEKINNEIEEKVAIGKLIKLRDTVNQIEGNIELIRSSINENQTKKKQYETEKNYLNTVLVKNNKILKSGALSEVEMSEIKKNFDSAVLSVEYEQNKIESLLKNIKVKENLITHEIDLYNLEINTQVYNEKLRLNDLKIQRNILNDRLKHEYVFSNFTGYIDDIEKGLNYGFIEAGDDFAKIVPSNESLLLDVLIPVRDSGFISKGDKAVIKLDSYPYTRYGVIYGKVKHIFTDSKVIDGESYFSIYIELLSKNINIDHKAFELKTGLTASVDILNGKRRIIYYFIEPIIDNIKNSLKER